MNYIKQLEKTVRDQRAEIEALHRGITEVRVYVASNKFFHGDPLDGYVSCNDIARRLTEIQNTDTIIQPRFSDEQIALLAARGISISV